MTSEQQRAILEASAKACGIEYWVVKFSPRSAPIEKIHTTRGGETVEWNPITNSADTAGMCAKLNINYTWMCGYVECWKWNGPSIKIEHDDTDADKEAAWRLAASMVAAKVGGYTDDI